MNEVLVSAGVAAIVIAIAGGGAKALGFEIPKLESGRRQVALGLVGVIFLGAAILLRDDGNGGGSNPDVDGYRAEVLATCRALQRGQPTPTDGVAFEKTAFMNYFRTQRSSWETSLTELWGLDPPRSLQSDQKSAESATDRLVNEWGAALKDLDQDLPERFDYPAALQYMQRIQAGLAAPVSSWEGAMSRLAGGPCSPVASG